MGQGDFRIERDGGRLRLIGELDAASGPTLAEVLGDTIGVVELDCSELSFVDSSGLRAIVSAATNHTGRTLRLLAPQPNVLRTLRIVGLDKVANVEIVPGE